MLSIRGLSKSYGGVPALRDVSLDLRAGEIHALMGENGAGKSTLIRVLAGVEAADRMEAALDGLPLALGSPAAAARAGIRVVHQELHVVPSLSVAENVLLARPAPRRWGFAVDWPRLHAEAAAALARLGALHIDPRARAGRLGAGDRMLVRLAAMLAGGGPSPRLFVLDEPTAALTAPESETLFAVLRDLARSGAAILYVSHRLDEVVALASRATVLRDGRVALDAPLAGLGRDGLVRAMTGRDVPPARAPRPAPPRAGVALRLDGVEAGRLSGLSLDLREGEVLGVAGLENAGGSDLLRLLLGDGPPARGRAEVLGDPLPRSPAEGWRRGIAYVPRERRGEGLMLGRGVTDNAVLPHLARLSLRGLRRPRREEAEARRLADRFGLRHGGLARPVRRLSGGNQQKVVLARAALGLPRLLLLDEPTRGVDVGARADIHDALRDLAAAGAAVVVASSDLPELLGLADRVLVLRAGRQAALAAADGLDAAALLHLVQGHGAHGDGARGGGRPAAA